MNFDFIIRNVKIIDGSTRRRFPGELAVTGDTISAVARPGSLKDSRAGREIDGRGMALAPGFIDAHSHDDRCFWDDPYNQPKLRQGVTTVVTGMCGNSPFPIPEEGSSVLDDIKKAAGGGKMYPWTARTLEEYAVQLREIRPAVNIIPVAGHRALRVSVMGFAKRRPLGEELAGMKKLLKGSLESGARGISTGLIYAPASYADTREIIELASTASVYGGIYFTHLRSEGTGSEKAIQEAADISLEAQTPLHIAHLKCLGRDSWGSAGRILSFLDRKKAEGIAVSWDQYPYTASSTGLISLLPPAAQKNGIGSLLKELDRSSARKKLADSMMEDSDSWQNFFRRAGSWDRILVCSAPGCEESEGRTVSEIADDSGESPFDTVFNLLTRTGAAAGMVVFGMSEEDVESILAHPSTCIGSDGIPGKGKCHPREYGTFARVLGRYAREKKLLSIEEAVRKMTALTAGVLGLKDRGAVKEGYKADIVIFNPDSVKDTADYKNPCRYPEGIIHVFVNGKPAFSDSKLLKERRGRVLLENRIP